MDLGPVKASRHVRQNIFACHPVLPHIYIGLKRTKLNQWSRHASVCNRSINDDLQHFIVGPLAQATAQQLARWEGSRAIKLSSASLLLYKAECLDVEVTVNWRTWRPAPNMIRRTEAVKSPQSSSQSPAVAQAYN